MAYTYGTNTGDLMLAGGKDYHDYIRNYLNQNRKGGNEMGNTMRRAGFGITPDFLQRIGFLNEIGPQRLNAIREAISRLSPGNVQALADQNRNRLLQHGNQASRMAAARMAGMGASQSAVQGAALAAQNQSNQAANAYQNQLYSPQGQSELLQALMGAYGQAENLNMGNVMQIFNAIEERHRMNQATKNQGGLGGILGGIAGSILPGLNLFGGGSATTSAVGTALKGAGTGIAGLFK